MTPAAASSGAGWLPVVIVLGLALWPPRGGAGEPAAGSEGAPRRRGLALLIVTGLVGGSVLLGTPAFAQPLSCKESPEPDRPGTGLVGFARSADVERAVSPAASTTRSATPAWSGTTYDLGCVGTGVFNPAVTTDTWTGQPDAQRRRSSPSAASTGRTT